MAATPWDGPRSNRLSRVLSDLAERHAAYADADARWQEAFFVGDRRTDDLVAIEAGRFAAADRLMLARVGFLPFHVRRRFPGIRPAMSSHSEVAAKHDRRLADPLGAFAPPQPLPRIAKSVEFADARRRTHWLRFDLTVGAEADTAWARVVTPIDAQASTPTVVFAHGIAMEPEMWRSQAGAASFIGALGLRSISVEGPWHGRRRRTGTYAGEPVLADGPMGLLDYFHRHVIEIGLVTAWARAAFGGPVAVAGLSLGALTGQLVATAAATWPRDMRPDALLLVTTSDSVERVAFEGSLSTALGLPDVLAAAGWPRGAVQRWRPLIEPGSAPALPPDRVVLLLGDHDDLTHFDGGLSLARRWQVPDANVFVRRRGHFTAGIGLAFDRRPLARFAQILAAVPGL